MTTEQESQGRSRSTELSAGTGFTFEDAAAAYYLCALLSEGYAPGVESHVVTRVAFQQHSFKEPLDDLVVDFRDPMGEPAQLSLQSKRSLTISAAPSNDDFREIIQNCWLTFQKAGFRTQRDRYGAVVGEVAKDKARALISLCEKARASVTPNHFSERFAAGGDASVEVTLVRNDIASILNTLDGRPRTESELHEFLAHFVLVDFDFLHDGAVSPALAMTQLRHCLAAGHEDQAPTLWRTLCQTVRNSGGKAGEFDRQRLVTHLSSLFRLRASPSLRGDLEKLTTLTRTWIADITNDVGGTHLERKHLADELDRLLTASRFVQIRGLPGSGKSVILRQRVDAELERGPVLFLKSDRLDGKSWASFATLNGLSGAPLESLLVEIEATGSNALFIDGIDRVEKDQQLIILDVLRPIFRSPLLAGWRIVVSLRDTGLEPLRNWLGDLLNSTSVRTLEVGALNDEEAETLAEAKPHLRGLLFGPTTVQEIVRRPFFAKILNQAGSGTVPGGSFQPQTEVDLIENWWLRGGYNADQQAAIPRQRALVEIAGAQARHLSQPVFLRELSSSAIDLIDGLIADGIVRHVRHGHTIRFVHDILFEWSLFHVLADKGDDWLEEVRSCGEPPAMARVVELLSQFEYRECQTWTTSLRSIAVSEMRSQWLRAWLLGPIGAATFSGNTREYDDATAADDFALLRKLLVWFQAEKTTPNANILAGDMPKDQRLRLADYLGWPSDYSSWRRLIQFILARIDRIPTRLYPDMVSVFEVWQNALAGLKNAISSAIVTQCAKWLRELDHHSQREQRDENSRWNSFREVGELRTSLVSIVIRSAFAMPEATKEYLERLLALKDLREEKFSEIVGFSPTLARTHPVLLVELTLRHLNEELPDDQVAREEAELSAGAELRRRIRAKPKEERTERDEAVLASGFSHLGLPRFSYHDWTGLSINHDVHNFWPASPLREPFHSLFKSSPKEAIRLVNEVCNHAMAAWRQLHRHIRENPPPGTPIPLVLKFPWGSQDFWGGGRQYIWYRGMGAPNPVECALMALEDWCFAELERGRPVDDLIKEIVEGNQCVAVLGVAALLALQTSRVSETVFPLVTSQLLLSADRYRLVQDMTGAAMNLAGFTKKSDVPHFEAVKAGNARSVRKEELRRLIPLYVLGNEFGKRTRVAIRAFKRNLPYEYEEHRDNTAARQHFTKEALEYAELADTKNYRVRKLPEQEGLVELTHVSPSAASPENVAKAERAAVSLRQGNLFAWADKAFERGQIDDPAMMATAIKLARSLDGPTLYVGGNADDDIEMRRGSVAATAAAILVFRNDRGADELSWARDVLRRARDAPDIRGVMWCSQSVIPWHPSISVARGLAADLRFGAAERDAGVALLALVTHPLELVSLTAVAEAGKLWNIDPKLVWAAFQLAFTLSRIEPQSENPRGPGDSIHSPARIQGALRAAEDYYRNGEGWPDLPMPPPAWIEAKGPGSRGGYYQDDIEANDVEEPTRRWVEPETHWYAQYAGKVLNRIPYEDIVPSAARDALLKFIAEILQWTNAKNAPPWVKKGRRDREASRLFEWNNDLASNLGRLSGLLPGAEATSKFLEPIFALEGETCSALLAPCVSVYICRYIYDAPKVPEGAIPLLSACLERFLKSASFDRSSYYGGEFHGFAEPRLIELLMFVSVERAALAARLVNGDWSEIGLILPLVDRFVRAGGWAAAVMTQFLTLCERAKDVYPAGQFADQVLAVIGDGSQPLKGWHGTFIPARVAGLVQHFANRETPMAPGLGQKLLRVLDLLVDMGDRRSAALQLSETFREIKVA